MEIEIVAKSFKEQGHPARSSCKVSYL